MDQAFWNGRYQAADLIWGAAPNRFVQEHFTGVRPSRALDVAAGEGRNAIWLASLGWQVTAVDFAAVAIDRGREFAAARHLQIDWVVDDVRTYQPEPNSFDAVIVAYLHLAPAERARVLRHAAAALAPGGQILVVGHDLTNLSDGIGGPPDPEILYTPQAIAAELPGLSIRRAERVRRPVTTDQGSVDAIDTLVTAVHGGPTSAADPA